MKNFVKFYQNWRNFSQKFREKGEWNQRKSLYFLESLNLDISLSKTKIKKIFLIPYSTLDKLSNDTSLNSLRWIYRSAKIDWTKKNPVEYIVPPPPPPLKRGRNKYLTYVIVFQLMKIFCQRNFLNDVIHFGAHFHLKGIIPPNFGWKISKLGVIEFLDFVVDKVSQKLIFVVLWEVVAIIIKRLLSLIYPLLV